MRDADPGNREEVRALHQHGVTAETGEASGGLTAAGEA